MTDRPSVYVTRRVPPLVRAELDAFFDIVINDADSPPPRDELLTTVKGRDGVLVMLSDKVDEEFLRAAGSRLRVVANYAAGYDNLDLDACSRQGVIATNTPDVLTEATAEFTWALLLGLVRRVSEGDRLLRSGTPWVWSPTYMLGNGLRGSLLGIVGLGRIGREVARLADMVGMDVIYTHPGGAVKGVGWRHATFDELCATADIVSLHCPLTQKTRHLVDRHVLKTMKRGAYLVNTSRGAVIDEVALAEALESGEIAGAALDVFEYEPEVTRKLLRLENVVLAPHLGSATHEARDAMGRLCVSALKSVLLDGQIPANALNELSHDRASS